MLEEDLIRKAFEESHCEDYGAFKAGFLAGQAYEQAVVLEAFNVKPFNGKYDFEDLAG